MSEEKLITEIDKLEWFMDTAFTLEILTDYEYERYKDTLYRILH